MEFNSWFGESSELVTWEGSACLVYGKFENPEFEQCILTSYWNKGAVFVNKMIICTIPGSFATNKAFPFSIEKEPFAWEEISSGSVCRALFQREI